MSKLPARIHRRFAAQGRDVEEVVELAKRLENGEGENVYREIGADGDEERVAETPEQPVHPPMPSTNPPSVPTTPNPEGPKIEERGGVEPAIDGRKVRMTWCDKEWKKDRRKIHKV